MKLNLITLLAVVFIATTSNAQQTADFFFNYKKSTLTQEHKNKLAEMTADLKLDSVQVKIVAHCDSVGGSEYNEKLGQSRADLFSSYFTGKNVPSSNITIVNNGSANPIVPNDSPENMALNRKVILTINSLGTAVAAEEVAEDTVAAEVVAAPCSLDTLISLEDGALMKISNCQYKKYKDCMTVKAYSTLDAIKNSKFTTDGSGSSVLSTAGIIDIRMCNDANLDSAITVYIPIKSSCKLATDPFLWTSFQNGIWTARSKKAEVETLNGKEYYSYTTKSSGTANFASEHDNAPEFQIKGKKGLKIKSVTVYYACELGAYQEILMDPKKKVKIKLPCPSSQIYFTVIGEKKGEEIKFEFVPVADVKAKKKQKGCDDKSIKRKYYFYPTAN